MPFSEIPAMLIPIFCIEDGKNWERAKIPSCLVLNSSIALQQLGIRVMCWALGHMTFSKKLIEIDKSKYECITIISTEKRFKNRKKKQNQVYRRKNSSQTANRVEIFTTDLVRWRDDRIVFNKLKLQNHSNFSRRS